MVIEEPIDGPTCGERVRAISKTLFGSTLGNQYRMQLKSLSTEEVEQAAKAARRAIIDSIFEDWTVAPMTLALMTRKREHAAIIFMALELANLSLMNPAMIQSPAEHRQWVEDISSTYDKPVAMILRCLEWLTHIEKSKSPNASDTMP